MEGAEGRGSRLLLLRSSQENQQIGRNRHNATPYQDPVFSQEASQCQGQSWARWQRGGPSASIALEVASVQLASLLKVAHVSDPRGLGSVPSPSPVGFPPPGGFWEEASLRLGCRKGARKGGAGGREGGARLCYRYPHRWGAECKSASVLYKLLPQAAAIEHLLTHLNIDPKEIPTFLSFFFF